MAERPPTIACRTPRPMGRFPEEAQRTGRLMAEKKPAARRGRPPPEGVKKPFLSSMDPEVIKSIKVAAAELSTTASLVLETAAKEWLQRYRAGKR
jgi:hypothetical protein